MNHFWSKRVKGQKESNREFSKTACIFDNDVFRLVTSLGQRKHFHAQPLSHRESVVSKTHYEVHI